MIKIDFKTWKKQRWDFMNGLAINNMEKLGIDFGDTVLIECADNTEDGFFGNGDFIPAIIDRNVPWDLNSHSKIERDIDRAYPSFRELNGGNYLKPLSDSFTPVLPAYMRRGK